LDELGVGKELFGKDFEPIEASVSGNTNDLMNANFVAFFLRGGNAAALMPSNEMKTYLQLAKTALEDKRQPWEYVKTNRDKLPLIIDVLKAVDKKIADKLEQALELPLTPKELAIDAGYLMNAGIEGPAIGQAQRKILQAIHNGKLENDAEKIKAFVGGGEQQ
jgi:hypothetical protein